MPYTDEPSGLQWINNLNTNSFGSITSQVCWFIGSVAFTVLVCYLMTREDFYAAVGVPGPDGVRQMVMQSRETMRAAGSALAYGLLGAWTGKTIVGAVDSNNKRKADPRYKDVLEAKERGKVVGAAQSLVLSDAAAATKAARENGQAVTAEHPAIQSLVNKPIAQPDHAEEPVWSDGREKAGIL